MLEIHILKLDRSQEIRQLMQGIQVDPFGIEIMTPKAMHYLIRINSLSNITANILKQEMLSLGGDAAIARDALTGRTKKTDCLLMGSLSQLFCLNKKLHNQPFGLNELSQDLSLTIENYQKEDFRLRLGKYKLDLRERTHIMGILNLTPDSFSGDGLYRDTGYGIRNRQSVTGYRLQVTPILYFVENMVKDGADIIDVGGESTRPGAKPVSIKEELSRIIPIIKALAKKVAVPISVDTYKPEVARQALDNGAVIVNDITGLRDAQMKKVVRQYKAGVVIMHMKGNPQTMQKNPHYDSLIDGIIQYFRSTLSAAQESGIDKEKIIIDPGIGFGKTLEHNLEILNRLEEFKVLGSPILVGTSRKSFLGRILNLEPEKRVFGASTTLRTALSERSESNGRSRTIGTVSSCVLAAKNGAKIVRVHDVKEVRQALEISDKICGGL